MPVRKRTAEGWNFSPDVLGYERNSDGDVVKVVCKVCLEAYSNSRPGTSANFNEAQKDIFVIDLFTDSDAIFEMSIWQCIMVYSGYMKSKQTRYRTT